MSSKNSVRLKAITANFILVAFMMGCNEYMVVGNLSLIAKTYHSSLAHLSVLVSVYAWSYAIFTPLITIATNHLNKFKLLLTMLIIFLAGTFLTYWAPTFSILMLARLITASLAGVIESLMQAIAYELAPTAKEKSHMVSLIYTGYSVATVLGLPIGTMISQIWSWQDAFLMVSAITLVSIIISYLLVPRNLPVHPGTIGNQLDLLKDKRTIWGIVLSTATAATTYGYYTYIRPLLRQTLQFNVEGLSLILFLFGIMDLLSTLVGGRLAEKDGIKHTRPIYLTMAILLLLFYPAMGKQISGFALLLAMITIFPAVQSPIQIYFLEVAANDYPSSISLASSLNAVFYNVGVALASLSAGQVLKLAGLKFLGFNSLFYCLVALLSVIVIIHYSKRK